MGCSGSVTAQTADKRSRKACDSFHIIIAGHSHSGKSLFRIALDHIGGIAEQRFNAAYKLLVVGIAVNSRLGNSPYRRRRSTHSRKRYLAYLQCRFARRRAYLSQSAFALFSCFLAFLSCVLSCIANIVKVTHNALSLRGHLPHLGKRPLHKCL